MLPFSHKYTLASRREASLFLMGTLAPSGHDSSLRRLLLCGGVELIRYVLQFLLERETFILTGSDDRCAKIWAATSAECVQTLGGHDGGIESAMFSYDASHIVTTASDGFVKLWKTGTGECFRVFKCAGTIVSDAIFSPDGALVCYAWKNLHRNAKQGTPVCACLLD